MPESENLQMRIPPLKMSTDEMCVGGGGGDDKRGYGTLFAVLESAGPPSLLLGLVEISAKVPPPFSSGLIKSKPTAFMPNAVVLLSYEGRCYTVIIVD